LWGCPLVAPDSSLSWPKRGFKRNLCFCAQCLTDLSFRYISSTDRWTGKLFSAGVTPGSSHRRRGYAIHRPSRNGDAYRTTEQAEQTPPYRFSPVMLLKKTLVSMLRCHPILAPRNRRQPCRRSHPSSPGIGRACRKLPLLPFSVLF
jgi:hypothetical protein